MRILRGTVALLLALCLVLSFGIQCAQAGELQVQIKAEYKYSTARSMLKLINNMRTGKDAWYISSNNRTRVKVSGLKSLEYDYNLERVAMQRALECAVLFSHTRPNGAAWSSLYPKGYNARGENLAYGFGTVNAAFTAFAEEKANYAGQGHRRNMLNKRFTRVGIGVVKVGNVLYWAQEFGCGGSKGSDNNRYKGDKVKVNDKTLKSIATAVQASEKEKTVKVGSSASVPSVVIISKSGAKLTLNNVTWTPGGSAVKVKNAKVTGVRTGRTKLTAKAVGKTLTVAVSVVPDIKEPLAGTTGKYSIIDDYETALATEYFILEEDDECFEADDEEFEADDEYFETEEEQP